MIGWFNLKIKLIDFVCVCFSCSYSIGVFLWEVMTLGENVGIVKQKLSTDQLLPEPDGCDRIL